jgi:hypothetical protein
VAPHVHGVKAAKPIVTIPNPSSQSRRSAAVWGRLRGDGPRRNCRQSSPRSGRPPLGAAVDKPATVVDSANAIEPHAIYRACEMQTALWAKILGIATPPNEPSLGTAPQKVAPLVRAVEATRRTAINPNTSSQSWGIAAVWGRLRGRCPRKICRQPSPRSGQSS